MSNPISVRITYSILIDQHLLSSTLTTKPVRSKKYEFTMPYFPGQALAFSLTTPAYVISAQRPLSGDWLYKSLAQMAMRRIL